ncbi:MAG: GDP-mannose 4,6-dehydratase [Rhizobiaceae bacterium]|nr:GDP-mannose 4,6-dehydratase [Rhizobiaceae bacterium]
MAAPKAPHSGPSARRVVITGAFGFVGRWLATELFARNPGIEIVGWGLRGEGADQIPGVRRMGVDIVDRAAVFAAMAEVMPAAVINLAAIAAPREAALDPDRAWRVNLFGAMNVAEAVLAKAPAARFVQISSSEVYGGSFARKAGPLDEKAALEPLNVYALTKAASDLAVGKLAHDGLKAVRFRPFNHTGPGQGEAFVVAALASQIARIEQGLKAPVLHIGNTNVSRDLLDVRDIVKAYASTVTDDDLPAGEVLNLASGVAHGIGDIADRLCAMAKVKIAIEVDPARVRANDLARTLGDASRAKALLGWQPVIPIERTLRDVLDFWREKAAAERKETGTR